MSTDVTVRRSYFGTTWAIWYGYRPGIQVNRVGGRSSVRPKARTSTWSRDLGDLGDKYSDATQDAWNASHWTLGKAVKSKEDALVAARWAYLEAIKESGRSEHYSDLAEKAAYSYSTSKLTALNILQTVAVLIRKDAPRAAQKVDALVVGMRAAGAKPKPKAPRKVNYPVDPEPGPLPPEPLTSRVQSAIPTWAPWAAAGGLVLIAALLLRAPAASPPVQKVTP